jgi:hypothetical protein
MATIVEILKAAEDNIQSIMQHKDNTYLRNFMRAAYISNRKLQLPETDPPYKINAMEEAQVPSGVFWQVCKKIEIFQKTYEKAATVRVENSFIQALESVSAKEAEIILAAKNQTLHKIYKGVTLEALTKVGYFK